jgi:hypothetical protein
VLRVVHPNRLDQLTDKRFGPWFSGWSSDLSTIQFAHNIGISKSAFQKIVYQRRNLYGVSGANLELAFNDKGILSGT